MLNLLNLQNIKRSVIQSNTMATNVVSIRLRDDQSRFIEKFGINLGEWVRNKFDEEFLNVEYLDNMIDKLQKEKDRLQCITDEEREFLKESYNVIQNNPDFIYGRIRRYINEFKKPCPSTKYFKKLMKEAKRNE